MPPTYYAHPVDVLRKFDPTISIADLRNGVLGPNGEANVYARIREVESTLERLTDHAWRERRVGTSTESYEYHDSSFRRHQRGLKIYLDHRHVLPFDANAGDSIEIRTGRTTWRDVTGKTEVNYELDSTLGIVWLYGPRQFTGWGAGAISDRNIRLSYRYGSLGGDQSRAGQTTLDGAITDSAGTATVAAGERLPSEGTLFLGGEEYALGSVSGDTLTFESRGLNGTEARSHADGTVVHYCPLNVREAVAAKAAVELVQYDDHIEALTESREKFPITEKVATWEAVWAAFLDKESDVKAL